MMFSSKSLIQCLCVASAAAFFVHEEDVVKHMDPLCPTVNHYTAAYHQDTACDRVQQNFFKENLNRVAVQAKLQLSGAGKVPSEQTAYCPQTVVPMTDSESVSGFDTAWIVENTASTPIVVAFMLAQPDGTFKEVSAFDNNISPPNHDPKAILQPEAWKSLQTYEGHVFHTREIMKDGSMGRILLQHRVGLIPVTNKYGHELNCHPADPDIEPVVAVSPGLVDRDPNFAREAPRAMRACNVLDVGFRNEVGCPLNAYYSGMYQLKGAVKPRGNTLVVGMENTDGHTPKTCHEVFKFHLGIQEEVPNFMFDWQSKTKYEGTYVGHNFVFRLASDERIVVDSIALSPTKVIDCPGLKNQITVGGMAQADFIIAPLMQPAHGDDMISQFLVKNVTATPGINSTEWAMQPPTSASTISAAGISPSASRRRRRASAAGVHTHSV